MEWEVKNTDFVSYMRELAERGIVVDMILSDPPYIYKENIVRKGGALERDFTKKITAIDKEPRYWERIENDSLKHRGDMEKLGNLTDGFDIATFWELAQKIQPKHTNIALFCNKPLLYELIAFFGAIKGVNTDILLWHKPNCIPFCNNAFLKDKEYIFYIYSRALLGMDKARGGTIFATNSPASHMDSGHPCQKPLPLLRWILDKSRPKSVLDMFLGSGSTAEACFDMRFVENFYGCEILSEWAEYSQKRIREACNVLF